MKEVYFATKNAGKVKTLGRILEQFDIKVVQVPLEIQEPRSDDVRLIAEEKIKFAFDKIGKPCVAIDAGFYVHSLNGFPKAFVNFALDTIGVEGILKLAESKDRACEFRECLAYLDENIKEPMVFESKVPGTLAEMPRGSLRDFHWSKLSLVFIPAGETKTLAEMSPEEYEKWRAEKHSDSVQTKFAEWFSKQP